MDPKENKLGISTLELIETFQNLSLSSERRDAAFEYLCDRFRKKILIKCEVICNNFGHGLGTAEEIAINTFKKYGTKPNFDFAKARSADADIAFEIYLYGISKNALTDHHRELGKAKAGKLYDGTEKIIRTIPELPEDRLDLRGKIMKEVIDKMPEKYRVVYLTYETYERNGTYMPRPLLKALRDELGITQNTVKSYKDRAKRMVDDYLTAMQITENEIKNER